MIVEEIRLTERSPIITFLSNTFFNKLFINNTHGKTRKFIDVMQIVVVPVKNSYISSKMKGVTIIIDSFTIFRILDKTYLNK